MHVVAVVHPTSLLAKELRERLEAMPELCRELRLLSLDDEEIGAVTESAGAAAFVGRLEPDSLEGVDLAFFCGDVSRERPALRALPRGTAVVLLSRGASDEDAPYAVAGVRLDALAGHDRLTSPHPAAVAAALLLAPLSGLGLRRAHATILMPVSLLGDAGIDELFEQTRGILAFAGNPRGRLFPAQIAFNVLPGADDAAAIERAAAAAAGLAAPLSLQIVQGGIFHGLAVALRVELDGRPEAAELRKALGRSPAISLVKESSKLGPVAVAGGEKLLVGEVRATGEPGAYTVWAVMDNLVRGGALNALELGQALLAAGKPH